MIKCFDTMITINDSNINNIFNKERKYDYIKLFIYEQEFKNLRTSPETTNVADYIVKHKKNTRNLYINLMNVYSKGVVPLNAIEPLIQQFS